LIAFADTSALFALVDRRNPAHAAVARAYDQLEAEATVLATTNYILLETFALLQRRLGLDAAREFAQRIVPLMEVHWVSPEDHDAGVSAALAGNRRDLSLVDCISFAVMRRMGLSHAFAVDEHFREQGFDCLPAQRPRK